LAPGARAARLGEALRIDGSAPAFTSDHAKKHATTTLYGQFALIRAQNYFPNGIGRPACAIATSGKPYKPQASEENTHNACGLSLPSITPRHFACIISSAQILYRFAELIFDPGTEIP